MSSSNKDNNKCDNHKLLVMTYKTLEELQEEATYHDDGLTEEQDQKFRQEYVDLIQKIFEKDNVSGPAPYTACYLVHR